MVPESIFSRDYRDEFGICGAKYGKSFQRNVLLRTIRRIACEKDQYHLKPLAYSETAGDSLEYHEDMKFSTIDRGSRKTLCCNT
uniref:Uncharacterized protein n=1 Tax=Anopheles albimanus TaxID=7167 RepID=A0A182F198_ANOAL